MTFDLGRRLLLSSAISPGELRHAVYETVARKKPFPRALADASATARSILEGGLGGGLEEQEGAISTVLPSVVPLQELVDLLPRGLLQWLVAVPVRRDPRSGAIDLAVVDPLDSYAASEVAFHLRLPVRARAASLKALEKALATLAEAEAGAPPSTERRVGYTQPPPSFASRGTLPPQSLMTHLSATPSEREEDAMPLVRRARSSLGPPSFRPASVPPGPISLAPITPRAIAPSQTSQASQTSRGAHLGNAGSVAMVLDFSASARESRDELHRDELHRDELNRDERDSLAPSDAPSTERGLPPAPSRKPVALKRAPFVSLAASLDVIERADTRDVLLAGLLRGLASAAQSCLVLVARKGSFVGLAAGGDFDARNYQGRTLPIEGALAEALTNRVRIGHLDTVADSALLEVLDLRHLPPVDVLLQPVFVAEKPAMVLVAFGIGDLGEAASRGRALAIAASSALARILKKRG